MRIFCSAIMFFVFASAIILPGGCSSSSERLTTSRERDRNQQLAAELTRKAADLMLEDPIEAERILQDALEADLYHGPAHNNLGVLLLNRGELWRESSPGKSYSGVRFRNSLLASLSWETSPRLTISTK